MSYMHFNQDDYSNMLQHNCDLTDQVRELTATNERYRRALEEVCEYDLDGFAENIVFVKRIAKEALSDTNESGGVK